MMTSGQHVPPTPDPRYEHALPVDYAPPANHWLRMLYAAWGRIRCLLTCVDDEEVNEEDVSDSELTELLPANPLSKSVTVYNTGDRTLAIYEGGALVAVVPRGDGATLPLSGLFAVSAQVWAGDANEGGDSAASIIRLLRCECGEEPVVYDTAPVGAYLL